MLAISFGLLPRPVRVCDVKDGTGLAAIDTAGAGSLSRSGKGKTAIAAGITLALVRATQSPFYPNTAPVASAA